MLIRCSRLQSDIFRPKIRTRLYLKMRPLVLSKAMELGLVTLWQFRTRSIAVCLSLPSHSWLPSCRVSLVFLCQTSYRWLGGSQGQSGRVRKVSLPPEFDLRTVQPVASRLRVHCTWFSKLLWSVTVVNTCRWTVAPHNKYKHLKNRSMFARHNVETA